MSRSSRNRHRVRPEGEEAEPVPVDRREVQRRRRMASRPSEASAASSDPQSRWNAVPGMIASSIGSTSVSETNTDLPAGSSARDDPPYLHGPSPSPSAALDQARTVVSAVDPPDPCRHRIEAVLVGILDGPRAQAPARAPRGRHRASGATGPSMYSPVAVRMTTFGPLALADAGHARHVEADPPSHEPDDDRDDYHDEPERPEDDVERDVEEVRQHVGRARREEAEVEGQEAGADAGALRSVSAAGPRAGARVVTA